MSHIRLTILVVSLLGPAVAHAADGTVYLYLQPLPTEAARLTFTIGSIAAMGANGAEYPLKLNLRTIGAREVARQRLLASGRLPSGSYTRFVLTVTQASLKDGRANDPLSVPEGPVRIDFPISVDQRSSVVWLIFNGRGTIGEGAFSPTFEGMVPPKPIADHAGFVTNSGSNTVTVFDKSIAQVVAVVDTCRGPAGMALDRPRRRLYLACRDDDEVWSVDVATLGIIERARVSPGDRPNELALTPDGITLLCVNSGSNSISFFDAASLTRQERVNVGSGPQAVVLEPSGRRAFVFNTLSSSMSVVEVGSRTVAATVSTEAPPLRGLFNRRGDRVFIIHERSPYMSVMNPQDLNIVTRARLRIGISAIAIDPIRDLVCVAGGNDSSIDFYDPNALMPLYSMNTRSGASYLAIDPEDSSLYVVIRDTRSVAIAGLATRRVAAELDVGEDPYWVTIMGEK